MSSRRQNTSVATMACGLLAALVSVPAGGQVISWQGAGTGGSVLEGVTISGGGGAFRGGVMLRGAIAKHELEALAASSLRWPLVHALSLSSARRRLWLPDRTRRNPP